MPSYPTLIAGTPQTWLASGGTYALTLTSLANGGAREGAKGDLFDATYGLPEVLEVLFETAVAVAATDGKTVELWAGESDGATAGSNNPGNLTGADAGVSSGDQLRRQLNVVGALSLSNARGINVQKQRFVYFPVCRYWIPMIFNDAGQVLSATSTIHRLTVTPYYRQV